jgi:hypothetical protein
MTRALSGRLAWFLFRLAASERHPTRTVEHMLAWSTFVWSMAVAWPGKMLIGAQYEYLIAIAPEAVWGSVGVCLATARLVALAINGAWRRTPGLRFVGAMSGLIWWLVLSALYWVAIEKGAPDFPMRYMLGVFIFFEGYSCFRCGQDHAAYQAQRARASGSTDGAGHV